MLTNRVCVLTGASSGIGKETAYRLAELDATLVLVCRNKERGEATIREIEQNTGNRKLDLVLADLSLQTDIRRAAEEILAKYDSIHILINNAGAAIRYRTLTTEGIEKTFAVNHLAYFLLTNLLLDRLKAGAPARILNVASEAHRNAVLDFENLQGEKKYSSFAAYSLTKLCNILFTFELAGRLQGSGVTANAMHPGFLATGIFREAPALVRFLVNWTAGNPKKGAEAIVHLVTSRDFRNVTGKYFRGKTEAVPSALAHDELAAKRLWELSASLTNIPGT